MFKFTEKQENWLRKLEANDLPQTQGFLQDHDGYCCLGVGCQMFFGEGHAVLDDEDELMYWRWFGEEELAPLQLVDELHLHGPAGEFKEAFYGIEKGEKMRYANLADLNDSGWDFPKIAAYIRANPENVFSKGAE